MTYAVLTLLGNAFMALVDATPSPLPAADHEAQILEVAAKVLTLVASLITLVLAPLVGAVILWNRRQQGQLDTNSQKLEECNKKHQECQVENVRFRERIDKLERIVHGARDNGQ